MNPILTLCLPFYRNSSMLAQHLRVWSSYQTEARSKIEIVLVDDGSPEPAANVPRPEGLPTLRIFRVLEDRLWNQHAARNLAAFHATGKWLLLTDMDHVLPGESLMTLLDRLARGSRDSVYTFRRLVAPDLSLKRDLHGNPHPHVNSFAITREHFWQIGGYDERLCGFHGTDGSFRRRLYAHAPAIHLDDVPLVWYSRDVVPDASTRGDRNAGRRKSERKALLRRIDQADQILVLQCPWERVL